MPYPIFGYTAKAVVKGILALGYGEADESVNFLITLACSALTKGLVTQVGGTMIVLTSISIT